MFLYWKKETKALNVILSEQFQSSFRAVSCITSLGRTEKKMPSVIVIVGKHFRRGQDTCRRAGSAF